MKKLIMGMDASSMMRDAFYNEVDPRRRQEIADSRMLGENPRAMANAPTKFIHQEYNQNRFCRDQNKAGSPDWEKSLVRPTISE